MFFVLEWNVSRRIIDKIQQYFNLPNFMENQEIFRRDEGCYFSLHCGVVKNSTSK